MQTLTRQRHLVLSAQVLENERARVWAREAQLAQSLSSTAAAAPAAAPATPAGAAQHGREARRGAAPASGTASTHAQSSQIDFSLGSVMSFDPAADNGVVVESEPTDSMSTGEEHRVAADVPPAF